jgi:hypothetical protein
MFMHNKFIGIIWILIASLSINIFKEKVDLRHSKHFNYIYNNLYASWISKPFKTSLNSNSIENHKNIIYYNSNNSNRLNAYSELLPNKFNEIKLDTINVTSFDVRGDGSDETQKIQLAILKSEGKILYFPMQKGKWYFSGQLKVPSNITLLFDPQVIFMAKDNLKQGISDFEVLFRIENAENVKIQGNGAHFRMNTSKYSSEYNHLFMINGSRNVLIKNVNAIGSGGDGIYVGAYKTKLPASYNVRIENVKANGNRRQGISVTSVDGFLAINSDFSGSVGARPQAGVCIEPSLSIGKLKNIVFKKCSATGNKGNGFQVTLIKNNRSTEPVDITFEDCYAFKNEAGFSSRYFSAESSGNVKYINCKAENNYGTGFLEGSCDANGAKKIYINCISKNNSASVKSNSSPEFYAGFSILNLDNYKKKVLGNSVYKNCKVENDLDSNVIYGFFLQEGVAIKSLFIEGFDVKGKKLTEKFKNLKERSGVQVKNI